MDYSAAVAKFYDPLLNPFLNSIRKAVVKAAKNLKAESIADFCCGTGNQIKFLKQARFANTIGIDLSEHMVAQAKSGRNKAECLLEDATNTSLPSNSHDLGIVSFALHEKPLETAQAVIKEMMRVIRNGGHLLIVDYCYDDKSSKPGRWATTFVEYLAGGEHYENFQKYISAGGFNFLMKDYSFIEEKFFFFGSVRLRIYKL